MNQIDPSVFQHDVEKVQVVDGEVSVPFGRKLLETGLPVAALGLGGVVTLVWAAFLFWLVGRILSLW